MKKLSEGQRDELYKGLTARGCLFCDTILESKVCKDGQRLTRKQFEKRKFCTKNCSDLYSKRKPAEGSDNITTSLCTKCNEIKNIKEFVKKGTKSTLTGEDRYSYCKSCHGAYQRINRLKKAFNITPEDYDKMFEKQGNVCAICLRPVPEGGRRMAIDHDHKTGLIRGILCWMCNRILGMFRDDAQRFKRASEYLISSPATKALGEERYGKLGPSIKRKRRRSLGRHLNEQGVV